MKVNKSRIKLLFFVAVTSFMLLPHLIQAENKRDLEPKYGPDLLEHATFVPGPVHANGFHLSANVEVEAILLAGTRVVWPETKFDLLIDDSVVDSTRTANSLAGKKTVPLIIGFGHLQTIRNGAGIGLIQNNGNPANDLTLDASTLIVPDGVYASIRRSDFASAEKAKKNADFLVNVHYVNDERNDKTLSVYYWDKILKTWIPLGNETADAYTSGLRTVKVTFPKAFLELRDVIPPLGELPTRVEIWDDEKPDPSTFPPPESEDQ